MAFTEFTETKSKNSMVTRDPLYLTIGTFLDIAVEIKIALLSLVWYLPRGSYGNTLCITTTGNVFVA